MIRRMKCVKRSVWTERGLLRRSNRSETFRFRPPIPLLTRWFCKMFTWRCDDLEESALGHSGQGLWALAQFGDHLLLDVAG